MAAILWRDRLLVSLGANALVVDRWPRGLVRPAPRRQRIAFATGAAGDWRPALAALSHFLDEQAWRGFRLEVLLGDALIEFGLLRAEQAALSAQELAAMASHHFHHTFGDAAQAWVCRTAPVPGPAGQPRFLACAVDRALIEALEALAAAHGGRLAGAWPRLAGAAARLESQAPGRAGHLLSLDGERASLAAFGDDGGWRQLLSRRLAGAGETITVALSQTLEQAEALAATGSRQVWYAGSEANLAVPGWQVHRLDEAAAHV